MQHLTSYPKKMETLPYSSDLTVNFMINNLHFSFREFSSGSPPFMLPDTFLKFSTAYEEKPETVLMLSLGRF